jgi:hypothetical protein
MGYVPYVFPNVQHKFVPFYLHPSDPRRNTAAGRKKSYQRCINLHDSSSTFNAVASQVSRRGESIPAPAFPIGRFNYPSTSTHLISTLEFCRRGIPRGRLTQSLTSPVARDTALTMAQDQLRVLIVGNGGREHALAWKLSQSPLVDIVYVAPGNGGTGLGADKKITNANVKGDDYPGLVAFAQQNQVNLVVPGPEAPLVDGIQGYFQAGEF